MHNTEVGKINKKQTCDGWNEWIWQDGRLHAHTHKQGGSQTGWGYDSDGTGSKAGNKITMKQEKTELCYKDHNVENVFHTHIYLDFRRSSGPWYNILITT